MTTDTTPHATPGDADTHNIGTAERHSIADLNLYHRNPRTGDVATIAASMAANGVYKPIVVNRGTHTGRPMEVLAGNHSLKAMRLLTEQHPDDPRWRTADCWVVDVDDDRAARIVLVDNRSADLGTYDDRLLADVLAGLNHDLDGTGYDLDDLADLSEALDGLDDGDDLGDALAPRENAGSLAQRFGVPPFTVLDSRTGTWQDRKRAWHAMGINSTVGRDDELAYGGGLGTYRNWYQVANSYPDLTPAELIEQHSDKLVRFNTGDGTSLFDPVLAELLVAWHTTAGDRVLDPWAGGSVRGLVSAGLGREYVGHELRQEQVDANVEQWEAAREHLPNLGAGADRTTDDPDALTPVQQVGDYWVKRDDLFAVGGSRGGKVRTCLALAQEAQQRGDTTLVTAGSRHSPQVNIVAAVAEHMGMSAQVHVPAGDPTPEVTLAEQVGAEVHRHRPGHNSVIVRRAADAAAEPGNAHIPFGMEHPMAVTFTAAQVANLPAEVTRVVMPVGSGMSLAGLLLGLQDQGRTDVTVLGVKVGADPTDRLNKYAPRGWADMCTLVDAEDGYDAVPDDTYLHHLSLDPHYEAKCLPFLAPGDLLWVVGRRATAEPDLPVAGAEPPAPQWVTGDSRVTMAEHPPHSFDLVLGCPPYYDIESYSDDDADLSTMTTEEFDAAMAATLAVADRALKPDRFAAFVVGGARDKRGNLRDMKKCMIDAAAAAGWHLANDAVLLTQAGSAAFRAGRAFTARRTLARVHQDVVIFVKGDRKAATVRLGDVYLGDMAGLTEDSDAAAGDDDATGSGHDDH